MCPAFNESSIPGRHQLSYRVLDSGRGFPTRDVEVLATPQEIEGFVRDGYLVRPCLLPESELALLRAAFDLVFAHDEKPEGTFVRHMADKHPAFLELIQFAPILSIARALLGPNVQSRGVTGRLCGEGEANHEVDWHFHQRVIPDPLPPLFTRPHTIDALIYLDEVGSDNGPLCVRHGSHHQIHAEHQSGNFSDYPDQVVLEVPAGSCVIAHGALWHRTLPRKPISRRRRLVISGYGACWLKPSIYGQKPENGLTTQRATEADEELRELLGLSGYM